MRKLKKLKLNVKKGVLKVNDKALTDVSCFDLHFENGLFTLMIGRQFYSTGKIKAPDKASAGIME